MAGLRNGLNVGPSWEWNLDFCKPPDKCDRICSKGPFGKTSKRIGKMANAMKADSFSNVPSNPLCRVDPPTTACYHIPCMYRYLLQDLQKGSS